MDTPAAAKTVEALLIELWQERKSADAVAACCEKLMERAPTELDKVELYLPQFAHIVLTLPDEVGAVASVERFILAVSQLSLHVVSRRCALLCMRAGEVCTCRAARRLSRVAAARSAAENAGQKSGL